MKLLLVDDNELNSDMLRRRLERHGFDVVMAVGGGARPWQWRPRKCPT